MSFLSFNFAIFVGIALLIFHLAPQRWRPVLLLVFSYAFYLSWSVVHTFLLAFVTAGVYATALWIENRRTEQAKRAIMGLGVMMLLVLLFGYKSAVWYLKEFFSHGNSIGSNFATLALVPLGLSYYVFKMLGYLLDVYWEVLPAQRNFAFLALYGAFFPQIVSGPIQRAESFFDQIPKIKNPDSGDFVMGLRRILFGLIKKVVIADQLSVLVENVYANPAGFSSLELLAGAYLFAIQLYADFSGITDIALGAGMLFGMKGPENFDLPFYSPNIQQFWRRWHMSLTTWLTDYLFTPLRMTFRKFGTMGLCSAVFINMIAIGLWHGQNWKFLIFGILHGIFVVVSVLTLKQRNAFFKNRPALANLRRFTAPLLTFHLVAFSLILFRADTLDSALAFFKGFIPGLQTNSIPALRLDWPLLGISGSAALLCLIVFFASEIVTWAVRQPFWVDWFFGTPVFFRRVLYSVLIAAVLLLFQGSVTFIYARF